ncbi:hypothetical protein OF83DRAFT_257234 [Amylostereum chailletii]|nr:hypothetical protein OF83DRAFT_257234 [Amylostereum chailletii]
MVQSLPCRLGLFVLLWIAYRCDICLRHRFALVFENLPFHGTGGFLLDSPGPHAWRVSHRAAPTTWIQDYHSHSRSPYPSPSPDPARCSPHLLSRHPQRRRRPRPVDFPLQPLSYGREPLGSASSTTTSYLAVQARIYPRITYGRRTFLGLWCVAFESWESERGLANLDLQIIPCLLDSTTRTPVNLQRHCSMLMHLKTRSRGRNMFLIIGFWSRISGLTFGKAAIGQRGRLSREPSISAYRIFQPALGSHTSRPMKPCQVSVLDPLKTQDRRREH